MYADSMQSMHNGASSPAHQLQCMDDSTEDLYEVIAVMRRQESTLYKRSDYITPLVASNICDAAWRQRIVEWQYGVVDHCALRRDSVAIAMCYVDMCVEKGLIKSRQEFQLAAMTALQLAIKLYDSTMVKLDSMVKLGRGLFTEQDVVDMETKMLNTMKWQVHPPTPVCFLRQYLRLLPTTVAPLTRYMIAEVTRFVSEISVCLYKFVKYSPSVVAFAGMIIAMDRIDLATFPTYQRQQVSAIMKEMVGFDEYCPEVQAAVHDLYQSLEKNISLQELMKTIDAQCHKCCGKPRSSDYYTFGTGVNSPRDVREQR